LSKDGGATSVVGRRDELMFTNRSTNEINVRVVFYGLPFVGKTTLLQRIYDATPEDQKGKMFSVQSGT